MSDMRVIVTSMNVDRSVQIMSKEMVKVKVKVICGSYSTAALRHIVLLPE